MKLYPFYTVTTHLKEFHDITLEDDSFETIGLHAWDKIGNKYTRLYKYRGKVHNNELELPCNADIIESVNADYESNLPAQNSYYNDYQNEIIEDYIEDHKRDNLGLYTKGKLMNYGIAEGKLVFNEDNIYVTVVYKGVILDEEGLPSLNYKEVEAIANYCAYVTTNKKAMVTKDKGTFEIAQMLKQEWQRTCDDARTPLYLNQNEMNQLLDIQTSWDRKRFNISFKPIR